MEKIGCCHKHLECQAAGECLNNTLLKGRNYDCYLKDRIEDKYKNENTFTKSSDYGIIKLTNQIPKNQEVVGMSKVHKKKTKRVERRVPVSQEEESKFLESRLAKLRETIEQNSGTVIEEEEMTLPRVSKKKERVKKEGSSVSTTTKQEDNYGGPIVTIKDLASELGVEPTVLRKKLRSSDIEKPAGRWEWPADHKDLNKVRAMYGKDLSPTEPEPEEPEDDEDEEELDYESMKKKELRKLCKERDLDYEKSMDKQELIELLEEDDEEEGEDSEDEEDDVEDDDEEETEEEEDEDDESEDDDEEDDEDDEEENYESMTKKELLALCKEYGIKVDRKMKKSELIDALEDDGEWPEEDE